MSYQLTKKCSVQYVFIYPSEPQSDTYAKSFKLDVISMIDFLDKFSY